MLTWLVTIVCNLLADTNSPVQASMHSVQTEPARLLRARALALRGPGRSGPGGCG